MTPLTVLCWTRMADKGMGTELSGVEEYPRSSPGHLASPDCSDSLCSADSSTWGVPPSQMPHRSSLSTIWGQEREQSLPPLGPGWAEEKNLVVELGEEASITAQQNMGLDTPGGQDLPSEGRKREWSTQLCPRVSV
ncbi:unnamed protein product [Lepidochelys kempii]